MRRFIIDAHAHLGAAGQIAAHRTSLPDVLARMDRFGIELMLCSHHTALLEGGSGIDLMRPAYDASGGRIRTLAVFNPCNGPGCGEEIRAVGDWPGLAGLKIHPSFHGVPADDDRYEAAWECASELGLAILSHTWSLSDHNPAQALSTPERLERWIRRYPAVPVVLGHAGGRGGGRIEAVRLARSYPNVYLDFAGDIYCYRLIEALVQSVSAGRILFGSDDPWMGPADHLTRVLLAEIPDAAKAAILHDTALTVYRLGDME